MSGMLKIRFFHSEMLFIRKIIGQKPKIIKLAALRQDNFLKVSSFDFPKSIKIAQKLIFSNAVY